MRCDYKNLAISVVLFGSLGLFTAVVPVEAQGPPGMFIQVIPQHDLDYGTLVQNQGLITKATTDQAIGKFEVWAQLPPEKKVKITIQAPNDFTKGPDEVPYEIRASYNTHADDPSTATEMSGLTATFSPQANQTYNQPPPPFPEASAYIYIHGTVDVEYQPAGTYSGLITLEAEMTN